MLRICICLFEFFLTFTRFISFANVRLAEVQKQIDCKTNIPADRQILVHEGDQFQPDSSVKCRDYPETSEQSPIILWQRDSNHTASDPILPNTRMVD